MENFKLYDRVVAKMGQSSLKGTVVGTYSTVGCACLSYIVLLDMEFSNTKALVIPEYKITKDE